MNSSIGKFFVAACLLLGGLLYFTWMHFLDDFYRQQIPAEVEVGAMLYADSGIRGGCGSAIFALGPRSKAQLVLSGKRALAGARLESVDERGPGISKDWKETPYIYRDKEFRAESYWSTLSCSWISRTRYDTIMGALDKPGSFFRQYKEGVTLVIPSADLVVYLFF